MKIVKGARHPNIIGQFGEMMICNWLSRSGFEVAIIDHIGIDIIASKPDEQERIGISVKSRTRPKDAQSQSVTLFTYPKKNSDRDKIVYACNAFGCVPWLGIYVECTDCADLYLLSLEHYDSKYKDANYKTIESWKMSEKAKIEYDTDPKVNHIKVNFDVLHWKWNTEDSVS